eukprot:82174-Lingulodinium_polyedra.AAC.1
MLDPERGSARQRSVAPLAPSSDGNQHRHQWKASKASAGRGTVNSLKAAAGTLMLVHEKGRGVGGNL